jgi:hypothetical protein
MEGSLARAERTVDSSGIAETLEAALGVGSRVRQLRVRTLLVGIVLTLGRGRPAHLRAIWRTLVGLAEADQARLGVLVPWRAGSHRLTYRQVEYTFGRAVSVLDTLIEASVPARYKAASTSLALDWSDIEAFARPPSSDDEAGADPEASWGHRSAGSTTTDLFFGYFLSAAVMVHDEESPAVPELVRRMTLSSCRTDPVRTAVAVLETMATHVPLGDVLVDSGYAHCRAEYFALPLRRAGAALIMDLHPHDRGRRVTYGGAICANGNLYCPATPAALLDLEPLARGASEVERAGHDVKSAELARYKLGPITDTDVEGYHRVMCPAAAGKVRCPRRDASMVLPYDRPEITNAPPVAPTCCTQVTLSVPPEVNAKTRQKHDYPSQAHRASSPGAPPSNAPSRPSRIRPRPTSPGAGAGSWGSPPQRSSSPAPSGCAMNASSRASRSANVWMRSAKWRDSSHGAADVDGAPSTTSSPRQAERRSRSARDLTSVETVRRCEAQGPLLANTQV